MENEDNSILPLTVDQAHIVTGIHARHLKLMSQGIMAPSVDHIDRINRSLGPEYLEHYNSHVIPIPDTIEVPKGVLPENRVLIRRTTMGELVVGDLIPYISPKRTRKTEWVEVRSIESIEESDGLLEIDLGGIPQYFNKSIPVRVARLNKQ